MSSTHRGKIHISSMITGFTLWAYWVAESRRAEGSSACRPRASFGRPTRARDGASVIGETALCAAAQVFAGVDGFGRRPRMLSCVVRRLGHRGMRETHDHECC